MQENKKHLINFAMNSGLILGCFWILKYLFVIGSKTYPVFNNINFFLSFGTPIILFYFLVKYKNNIVKENIGFWHGIQFSIMLFFFASLLEAIIIIIHVLWIDPAYISTTYDHILTLIKSLPIDNKMMSLAKEQSIPSPFSFVFNMIMGNVFTGIILSLIIVPLAIRVQIKDKNTNAEN